MTSALPGYDVTPEGEWVNSEHRRIAEVIKDFSDSPGAPQLRLAYIRPTDRTEPEDHTHPFAVIQKLPDGDSAVIFTLREDELDHRVIARIFAGDWRGGDVFARMAKEADAQKVLEEKRKAELKAQDMEFARTVLRSNKHSFKHNGVQYG